MSLTGERLSNMVTRTRDRLEHSVELGQNELTTQLGCASDLLNRQLQDQKTNLNLVSGRGDKGSRGWRVEDGMGPSLRPSLPVPYPHAAPQ